MESLKLHRNIKLVGHIIKSGKAQTSLKIKHILNQLHITVKFIITGI